MPSYRPRDSVCTLGWCYCGRIRRHRRCAAGLPVSGPFDAASQPDARSRTAWHCVVNVSEVSRDGQRSTLTTSWQGSANSAFEHMKGCSPMNMEFDI